MRHLREGASAVVLLLSALSSVGDHAHPRPTPLREGDEGGLERGEGGLPVPLHGREGRRGRPREPLVPQLRPRRPRGRGDPGRRRLVGQRDEERIERGGVLEGRGGDGQVPPGGRGVRQGRGRLQVLEEGEAVMSGRLRGAVMAAGSAAMEQGGAGRDVCHAPTLR